MKKEEKFKKLKTLIQSKGKATAELEASKNPEQFLKKMKNPSWKNLKGVAF